MQWQASPSTPNYNNALNGARTNLRDKLKNMDDQLSTPDGREAVAALAAGPWTTGLQNEIVQIFRHNKDVASTATTRVGELFAERQKYFGTLEGSKKLLNEMSVKADTPKSGTADIGLTLPRPLFANSPKGLGIELKNIDFVLRTISEVYLGHVEEVEVGSISTSDPLFFFHTHAALAHHVIKSFEFAIHAFNDMFQVRRALQNLLSLMPDADLKDAKAKSDQKLQEVVQAHAKDEVAENSPKADAGRKMELQTSLAHSLTILVEYVESGVTVQLRIGHQDGAKPETVKRLAELQSDYERLEFPKVSLDVPVLRISHSDPPSEDDGAAPPS